MAYPGIDMLTRPETGLVATYIQYIGEHEPDNQFSLRYMPTTDPHHASLAIGRACTELVHGDDQNADRLLRGAYAELGKPLGTNGVPPQVREMAIHLRNTVGLILARDDPDAPLRYQEATYRAAMTGLRQGLQAIRATHQTSKYGETNLIIREQTGSTTRDRMVALLTRKPQAGIVSMLSLPHHDEGQMRQANYDIMVIETGGNSRHESYVHKIQAKHCCLGFCGDEIGKAAAARARNEYDDDIILASGHCDTRTSDNRKLENGVYGTDYLLQTERSGMLPDDEQKVLDSLALRLLIDLTYDPWQSERRGLWPAMGQQEYNYKPHHHANCNTMLQAVEGRAAAA